MIEYSKAGEWMDNKTNNAKVIDNASFDQAENKYGGMNSSSEVNPRTMTIGDTTVNISFSESGDLHTRLANAFQTMLNS